MYRNKQSTSQTVPGPYDGIEFVPFVVMLAADSADTQKNDFSAAYGELLESTDPLRGLLLAICEREELRHKMPPELNAEVQLGLIEYLAGEFGERITDEDVQLVLSEIKVDPELRVKFVDHNLIRRMGQKFEFTYDFVFDYLRASVFLNWLRGSADFSRVRNVLIACAEQPGNLLDGIADLVRSVCGDAWVSLAHARWTSLRAAGPAPQSDKTQAGFFHVILALVKRDPQRATRTERLLFVFGDYNAREFSDLYLEGSLDNLDLRNAKFKRVSFGDVEFAHCQFDETTRFENCRFQKRLFVENCTDFGHVKFEGGSMTAQARSTFQRFMVPGVDKRILPDQIEEAIVYVLRKFHRGVGIKTCKEEGIRGSLKNEYGFGDEVIEELVKAQVIERFRHGTLEMLRVKAKGDVFQFFNNNYRRGAIRAAYDALVEQLAGKKQ